MALEKMSNQFSGLDMGALIGGPLKAACDAQTMLAASTFNFIEQVGFEKGSGSNPPALRTTSFSFERAVAGENGNPLGAETVTMSVPLLSIVKIPTFAIDEMNVTFDMEVKSSEMSESTKNQSGELDAKAGLRIGPFSMEVKVKGSISCHEHNTRSSDNSAKYHVDVHAKDYGMPEGLARMMDILSTAALPTQIQKNKTVYMNNGGGVLAQDSEVA